MMHCLRCGKEVKKGANFCRYCGASAQNAAEPAAPANPTPSAPPIRTERVAEPIKKAQINEVPASNAPFAKRPSRKKPLAEIKLSKWLPIVGLIVINLLIGGAFLLDRRLNSSASTEQQKNVSNSLSSTETAAAPQTKGSSSTSQAFSEDSDSSKEKEKEPSERASTDSPFPGEHYPKTRTDFLTSVEIAQMNYAQVRYAINEMFARYGYDFKDRSIKQQFQKFSWYHPVAKRNQPQIVDLMSGIEKDNLKRLSIRRDFLASR